MMRVSARQLAKAVGGTILLLLVCGPLSAEERPVCPICRRADAPNAPYPEQASYTLIRGMANTLLGWTELIRQPAVEVREGHHLVSGLGKGLVHSLTRTGDGAAELLTFWVPRPRTNKPPVAHDCPLCMRTR